MDRIKSRSRISLVTAVMLVKEQGTPAIPESASGVQLPEVDSISSASDESQVPASSSLTSNQTTMNSESLDNPEVAARDPIAFAQIATKPDVEVTVSKIKSEPLVKPEVAAKEPVKISQIAEKSDDEVPVTVTLEKLPINVRTAQQQDSMYMRRPLKARSCLERRRR